MYNTTGLLPVDSLAPGTSLFCTGPPMVGKREFGYGFLATGLGLDEGAVLVTMTDAAGTAREAVATRLSTPLGRVSDRFHVVDATSAGPGGEASEDTTHVVTSPADLTGMSIGVGNALEALSARDVRGVRLVVDSVTTLLVYNDPDRVYRFIHNLVSRIRNHGAVGCVFSDPGVEDPVSKVRGLFDGLVEFQEGADGRELRLSGGAFGETDWHPFESDRSPIGTPAGASSDVEAAGRAASDPSLSALSRTDSTAGGSSHDPREPIPESLHAVIDSVAADRQMLSVLNFTGPVEDLDTLESAFDRLNVSVRVVDLPVATPADVALLHSAETPTAMAPTEALVRAVRLAESEQSFDLGERPALLDYVDRGAYTVDNGGKRYLVGISRMIEERARRIGRGELHAGFQTLDRLMDEYGTRRMYDALASTDVDVHLYGEDGAGGTATELTDWFTVHTAASAELAESWFVVFDGGGVEGAAVSLLTEEREPERYHGFWSRDADLTSRLARYLTTTYRV